MKDPDPIKTGKKEQNKGVSYFDAWLSLVERGVRDAEVAGSNPVASIYKKVVIGYIIVFIKF